MNYTIKQIEDKILSSLRDLKVNNRVKTLDAYQGDLEDALENPERLIVLFPAVLVVFSGNTYTENPHEVYIQRISFDIIIGSNSLRGEKQRTLGVYELLEDVREILTGNQLDLQIPPLSLVREQPVLVGKVKGRFLAVYAATYSADIDYTSY